MNISLEQIITIITLLFGGGVFSFFAKNRQTNRQDKRDDFKIITEALYVRIGALEEDMENIKKRNKELIEENRQKSNQIAGLKEEVQLLLLKNKRLENEKNKLSNERESLIVQIHNLNRRVERLETDLRKEKITKEDV